jgi:hypothetical protein
MPRLRGHSGTGPTFRRRPPPSPQVDSAARLPAPALLALRVLGRRTSAQTHTSLIRAGWSFCRTAAESDSQTRSRCATSSLALSALLALLSVLLPRARRPRGTCHAARSHRASCRPIRQYTSVIPLGQRDQRSLPLPACLGQLSLPMRSDYANSGKALGSARRASFHSSIARDTAPLPGNRSSMSSPCFACNASSSQ